MNISLKDIAINILYSYRDVGIAIWGPVPPSDDIEPVRPTGQPMAQDTQQVGDDKRRVLDRNDLKL